MKAVVFMSGGLISWGTGKRAVQKYGAENTTLLFTDTKVESPGLYTFLAAAAKNIGAPLIRLADGRTPMQVFKDVKMLGSSQRDPCSRILKREPAQRWLRENCDPANTVLVFGIDWTETHRYDSEPPEGSDRRMGVKNAYARLGWPHVEAPMMDAPFIDRRGMVAWARLEGLPVSPSYDEGFAHDNCGGACVKAGKGAWAHLLRVRPDVYAEWEDGEDDFNAGRPGKKPQTILRDEIKGQPSKPVSLRQLRERIQNGAQIDMFDIRGCGCFLEDAA
jgi:hypothetical protein